MITVKGLTKRYARNTAVDRISFEVERGQIVGFLGPNGAGKTTTMRMLTCFLTPSGGAATVAGYDILEQPLEVKKRIGYLPESPYFYDYLTAEELLGYFASLLGYPRAERRRRIPALLDEVGIGPERRMQLRKFSKGMLQRVGIAQAILNDPDVNVRLIEAFEQIIGRGETGNVGLARN